MPSSIAVTRITHSCHVLEIAGQRILTALWVQCMYLWKAVAPITLSADYSYKQIRLVMGPDDWRAWVLITIAGGDDFASARAKACELIVQNPAVQAPPGLCVTP